MAKEKKLWPLGEQTLGKHLVLDAYLKAWFPIMGSTAGRILFIDAFAGPGEYEGGEEGSPLIAIAALRDHASNHMVKAEVGFVFIEADPARARHLETLLQSRANNVSANFWTTVENGLFDERMGSVLDELDSQKAELAPAFVMVDPFGVSNTPMSVIRRILENPRTEIYVSFMYEPINRFISRPEFEPHLDSLFGSPDWRKAITITDSARRKRFLHDLYSQQLKRAGAKYVLEFELYRGNRHVYTVFFGTQHLLGCDRMKQAMWKVAPTGEYAFYGGSAGQTNFVQMGLLTPDLGPLKAQLQHRFGGKGWVTIEEVWEFVQSDETLYHTGQLKKGVLKGMEVAGELEVEPSTRKVARTYPPGCEMRFK